MDLNQMLRAHQIALIGKARATNQTRRSAYEAAIKALATRIRRARKAGGADVTGPRFIIGDARTAYADR